VFVGCLNEDKGGIARKACDVACIGCSKCEDVCPKDAITMNNNLAYIDPATCTLCRKCVEVCPTHSIIETNFPPKKVKKPKEEKPKVEKAKETVAAVKADVESAKPKTDA
jgi:ferredoxin